MEQKRENQIVRISIQGIFVNIILVAFKAAIGIGAHSIAIILDAVNNMTDAFSQVITIIGTKLSLKKPDKKHPYGYGRIEYISSTIVAALILVTGITSLKESVLKTISPEKSEYSAVSLIIISVTVVVKFFFGNYVKSAGKKIESDALVASGTDAVMDSALSLSTLAAALVSKFAGISLEGILGIVLSAFIIKAGFEIISETLGSIIGGRADSDLSQNIKARIRKFDGVLGAYDLILHDYGPSRSIASVHIEVPAEMTAAKIHLLTRRITGAIFDEFGIVITVGIYASNSTEKTLAMKKRIVELASQNKHFIQLHGFFVDEEDAKIFFDTVISYKADSPSQVAAKIREAVENEYPEYKITVNIDHDFSD